MLVDPERLFAALRLPAAARVEAVEPLTAAPGGPERVVVRAGERELAVLVRDAQDERGANNAAVLEALERAGYAWAPRLLAVVDGVSVETFAEGQPLLPFELTVAQLTPAIDALAALHMLPVREGLRWEQQPADLLVDADFPFFRLGYGAEQRRIAAAALEDARQALLSAAPFGFIHGDATAAKVIATGPDAVALVGFGQAGHGLQLDDVAALLLTSGLDPATRSSLALRYAAAVGRKRGEDALAGLIDVAGLLWGLNWLLGLPRRLITALGDEQLTADLRLMASRVETGIAQAAGGRPEARLLREALFQG
jgi:hypothetical protein